MTGVLYGFVVITVIVLIGMLLGYTNVLGPHGRAVINRLCYFVAGPALVFTALLNTELEIALSTQFLIAGVTAVITALLGIGITCYLFKRDFTTSLITGVSSSMVNSANMGFPIAAYVLGDMSLVLPVALWQMGFFTPLFQFALHTSVSGNKPSVRAVFKSIFANPMILAAIVGISLLALNVPVPELILEPISVVGDMSIPGMLIAFGMSLTASKPFAKADGVRKEILLATFLKLLIMPALAWLVAGPILGFTGPALYASVVFASLPTAQNVYVAAARFEVGEELTRDAALFTSVGTVFTLMLVALIFGG